MSKIQIEDFILQHRDAFDSIEPAPLAATAIISSVTPISSTVKSITMKLLAIITIPTVAVITYLNITNNKSNETAAVHQKQEQLAPIEKIIQPEVNNNVSIEIPQPVAENPIIPSTNKGSLFFMDESFEADPQIWDAPVATDNNNQNFFEKRGPETFIWSDEGKSAELKVDTAFTGITHIEVSTNSFNLFVKGESGKRDVHLAADAENSVKGIVINDPKIEIKCTVEGNVLKVTASMGGSTGIGNFNSDGDLTLTIPENTTLKVNHDYGNMEVSNLITTMCDLNADASNVKISNITAPLNVHVDYGNVQLDKTVGNLNLNLGSCNVMCANQNGDVKVKSNNCNLSMGAVNGNITGDVESGTNSFLDITGNIKFNAGYSNIKMTNVKGDLSMNASSGNIIGEKIEVVSTADFNTEYGNVDIDFVNDVSKMSFELKTTYGNIKLNDGVNSRNAQSDLIIERGGIKISSVTNSGNIIIK